MPVSLNHDAVRRLLDEPIAAVLATVNADGSPQTSVVWVLRDGDELLISTEAGRRKERNVRRDPRVSLSVFDPADTDLYVEIRGVATVEEDPGREFAVRVAEAYEGPGGGEEYRLLPPEKVRVIIRIVPRHLTGSVLATGDRSGSG